MKKQILYFALLLGLAESSWCQSGSGRGPQWNYQSFLSPDVVSITVSNTPLGVTNLNSTAANGASPAGSGTNTWGTTFTNLLGAASMVTNNASLTNTFGTYESFNLLQDANLWTDRNGTFVQMPLNIAAATTVSNSLGCIFIKLIGQSGANAAVNFIFCPSPDGTNETCTATDIFTVGVTATTTTPASIVTNLPNKWVGIRKLRLRSITNTDTDATAKVDILNCALLGYGP